jgi:hypothetical protein
VRTSRGLQPPGGHQDRRQRSRGARAHGPVLARPPVATDRLSQLEDGRVELQLKRPWRDGTTAFRFTAHELIERLVAIVPRPRTHLARLPWCPGSSLRGAIRDRAIEAGRDGRDLPAPGPTRAEAPRRPGRFPWASLIWRVFLDDVLACSRCSGRMTIVAAVTSRSGVGSFSVWGSRPTFLGSTLRGRPHRLSCALTASPHSRWTRLQRTTSTSDRCSALADLAGTKASRRRLSLARRVLVFPAGGGIGGHDAGR